jgi:hypothetical protein
MKIDNIHLEVGDTAEFETIKGTKRGKIISIGPDRLSILANGDIYQVWPNDVLGTDGPSDWGYDPDWADRIPFNSDRERWGGNQ